MEQTQTEAMICKNECYFLQTVHCSLVPRFLTPAYVACTSALSNKINAGIRSPGYHCTQDIRSSLVHYHQPQLPDIQSQVHSSTDPFNWRNNFFPIT